MESREDDDAARQRKYYADTAEQYDAMHLSPNDEHFLALGFLTAALDQIGARSILDVGCGTGRAIRYLGEHRPDIHVLGVEPVEALRSVAFAKGIENTQIVDGDATRLTFGDNSFDLVCEFGVLHHVRQPEVVVSEMLRVASKAIFISDVNNLGTGSAGSRAAKQALATLRLWRAADLIKTRGRGYRTSEGDGLSYSYSVFDNYRQISRQCSRVHVLNTKDGGINPRRTASHIALLGVK